MDVKRERPSTTARGYRLSFTEGRLRSAGNGEGDTMTTHSSRAALLLLGILVSSAEAQRRPADVPRAGREPLPALLERTPRKAAADADELQKLLVERYNEAVKEVANLTRLTGIRTARNDSSLV